MKNKNKLNRFEEYTVYGLNGVKSLLESDRCSINKIILSDIFDLNNFSYKNLLNKKYGNKLLILNKNEFQNKYGNLRTQGIVITFSYKLSSDFPIDIEKINNLFSNLSSLTFWQLKKLKKDYKSLGYSTLDINSHLEKIYAYPIYLSIMTLFAGIIMLNIKFNKPKIFNIILGILLSVVIYYITYFSNILGENGKISTTLAVWMPLLILSLISSIGLVRINEK